jgi:hypothetical protein
MEPRHAGEAPSHLARCPATVGLTGDPKETAKIAAQFAAVFFKGRRRRTAATTSCIRHRSSPWTRLEGFASLADASIEDMATITALLQAEPG